MKYFTKDFLLFLQELAANNDREWFHANKKRFDNHVKKPFDLFVVDAINAFLPAAEAANVQAKDAVFRIYKDTRFSKDKTPYKLHMSAIISEGGRKSMDHIGAYIELSAEHARIYCGIYMPEKEQLHRIRSMIAADVDAFNKLLDDKDFKKYFGEIRGERNKVIDKSLKAAAQQQDLIYNKQFYYFSEMKPELVLQADFMEQLKLRYQAAAKLNKFFAKAITK